MTNATTPLASGGHLTGRIKNQCGILGQPGRLDWQLHAPASAGERHSMTIQWSRKNDDGKLVIAREYTAPVSNLDAKSILRETENGIEVQTRVKGVGTTAAHVARHAIRYAGYRHTPPIGMVA